MDETGLTSPHIVVVVLSDILLDKMNNQFPEIFFKLNSPICPVWF